MLESIEVYDDDKILVHKKQTKRIFTFEGCFKSTSSQTDVFESTNIRKMLDTSLNGFSSTIFVYGQTGSGKTYT